MKISYNWLQTYFKTPLPKPEKLADLLSMHFAEVENVKKEAGDHVLNIDVRPNRAGDCFSHLGVARECAAVLNIKMQEPKVKIVEDKKSKTVKLLSVDVRDKKACPRYTARVISGVKVGSSPKWMQQSLEACGLRPINNIVDVTNYVMLEMGQPLHAFDYDKIQDKKIIVRYAKQGEKIVTLDNEKYDLSESVLVIADSEKPVAVAGIKGGKSPEIDVNTKTVVLESANFNNSVVRKGSKKIDLKTDASLRFEHGIDPNLTELAINRAAQLIQEIAGGKVASGLADVYPVKRSPKKISLDLDYLNRLLGVAISDKQVLNILVKLGFRAAKKKPNSVDVIVPTFRLDLSLPEDLVEEIGRIYGYQNIKPVLPVSPLAMPSNSTYLYWENAAKDILKEAGFSESYNYSFLSEKDVEIFNGSFGCELIELANPLSTDYKYLRPSLIPNLLKNVQKNQDNSSNIKIFELGKIFFNINKEERSLSGIISGDAFYSVKGAVDSLLSKLGIEDITYEIYHSTEKKSPWWNPKKTAQICSGKNKIGFLGEISGRILNSYKIKSKLIYFDIFFERAVELASAEKRYKPILRYPSAARDIAVLVPIQVKAQEVINNIRSSAGSLLQNIELFDVFEGGKLPEGKKNLAFHLNFQSADRTLSSKEIDDLQTKIINILEENPEWQVRK